ncbi:hypothetical protein BURPSPAST_T0367 [Burkholderia pseudomallei Pasteur 52237]|nr:hypothetical protein BURPSPAST_T0367 [Burkholderia pseudomallei Pasteur 52237]
MRRPPGGARARCAGGWRCCGFGPVHAKCAPLARAFRAAAAGDTRRGRRRRRCGACADWMRNGCGTDARRGCRRRAGRYRAGADSDVRPPIRRRCRCRFDADAGPIEQPDARAGEPGAPQPPPTTARRLLRAASRPSRRAISGRRSAARCR